MSRPVTLNVLKGGINRLRVKGGASQQVLYDCLNGHVTAGNDVVARPGTEEDAVLPTGATKGLCAFDGGLVVFSHTPQVVPAGYTCEIVNHPITPSLALLDIHFASQFLGYLYVVAEFSNGDVYHYWLEQQATWSASTHYRLGSLVQPTVANGFAYRATRVGAAPPAWVKNVPRTVGERVQPTEPNGLFDYEVISTIGATPRSGATEPTWPEVDAATVVEDTTRDTAADSPNATDNTGLTVPPDVEERYGNPAGNRPEDSAV